MLFEKEQTKNDRKIRWLHSYFSFPSRPSGHLLVKPFSVMSPFPSDLSVTPFRQNHDHVKQNDFSGGLTFSSRWSRLSTTTECPTAETCLHFPSLPRDALPTGRRRLTSGCPPHWRPGPYTGSVEPSRRSAGTGS